MFGGAYFNLTINRHIVVNDRIWTFDFDKLEWSVLSSIKMPKPTYFHAAAINEVKVSIELLLSNFRLLFPFSVAKSGLMAVLSPIHAQRMKILLETNDVPQHCTKCTLKCLV